jgi:hypothetical protein
MPGRSVAEKLLVRPGGSVWISDGERSSLLGALPDGATFADGPEAAGVALVVADDASAVRAALDRWGAALAGPAAFWVAYPKGGRSDINRDTLWPILAGHGFRPISQVALDDTWSALRFRVLREGEAQFTGGR